MMQNYLANPLEFLISTLFSLYILAVMLRFLLGVVHADFYNPVSQFLVRVTNPLLVPMRKILPGIGKLDTAAIVLMLVLQLVSVLLAMLLHGVTVPPATLLLYTVGQLLMLLINIFMVAILVQALLSWISPGTYTPVSSLLYSLTSPVLKPIQRILPPLSGIDLSPLFALIGLQMVRMLILPLLG
jgi:YggT family protein